MLIEIIEFSYFKLHEQLDLICVRRRNYILLPLYISVARVWIPKSLSAMTAFSQL
jgi:hypothetical protein